MFYLGNTRVSYFELACSSFNKSQLEDRCNATMALNTLTRQLSFSSRISMLLPLADVRVSPSAICLSVNRLPNPGNRRARADAKATFNFVYRNSDFVCPGGRSYPICHDMLRLKVSSTRRLSHLVTACTQSNEMEFAKKSCVPCESKDLRPMSEQVANELLQQVPGWGISEEDGKLKLHRAWKVKSFMKGLEFFRRVADVAEAEGHHPDLHLVNWNNVKIDIWTHSIGGLTENDFILAAKISALDVESLLRKKTAAAESHTLP